MSRITESMVDGRVRLVNKMLGIENPGRTVEGSIVTDRAYGGTRIDQITQGGHNPLSSGYGTSREAYLFLGGIMTGLRIGAERREIMRGNVR